MRSVLLAFEPHEWELLIRLPAKIMIAASAAEPDNERKTVDEGLAGINAIAAGASSDSDLVKATVAAIYAEADPDPPTSKEFDDPVGAMTEVFVSCRAASLVLDSRASRADGQAYRQWVESIADRVCGAAKSGGALRPEATSLSAAEQEFLHQLAEALRNA